MLAARWLSLPAVWGLKGHSIVFETDASIPPEALFLEFEATDGVTLSPEVIPRPDGTTYVCAISTTLSSGACYRPIPQDGMPLIGPVPGASGVYVATGHSVWGILNAPATAEAIADGAASKIDLAPFDPARLSPLDPGNLVTL